MSVGTQSFPMHLPITVVGGGVIGVACALELQRRGYRVTLLEKTAPGEGCSYGNAGCISVGSIVPMAMPGMLRQVPKWLSDPMGPLTVRWGYLPRAMPWLLKWVQAGNMRQARLASSALTDLFRHTYSGYHSLLDRQQYADLIRHSGHLYVWRKPVWSKSDELAQVLRDEAGVRSERLDAGEVRELEPAIAHDIQSGLLLPDNGYTCNPEHLVKALATNFVNAGGTILRRKVLAFEIGEQGPIGVHTDCGTLPVSAIVVCAGASSSELLPQLTNTKIPLGTERGYHVMLRAPTVQPSRPIMDCERKFIVTPMEGGLRVAGTVEIAAVDAPPDYRRARILASHGQALFPSLLSGDQSVWMGCRPSIPDSLPVIDRSDRFANVFFAFGHGHLGLTGAPGTAELIADLVAGHSSFGASNPFGLQRFKSA